MPAGMKKIIAISMFVFLGSLAFAQMGLEASLGFQYGLAKITDNAETLREVKEPGVLATFRWAPQNIGIFGRLGLLFPSQVAEGDLTLNYSQFKYILFFNGGVGAAVKVPLNERFTVLFDAGVSINDLLYGGSYRETIDARWEAKLENIGTTYSGGREFEDVNMKEVYNDIGVGLLGNLGMRFNFTQSVYLELGVAATFDFLRFKSYKFVADFSSLRLSDGDWAEAKKVFPDARVDDDAKQIIFEKDMDFSVFKQFTFIPSISVGYSF